MGLIRGVVAPVGRHIDTVKNGPGSVVHYGIGKEDFFCCWIRYNWYGLEALLRALDAHWTYSHLRFGTHLDRVFRAAFNWLVFRPHTTRPLAHEIVT